MKKIGMAFLLITLSFSFAYSQTLAGWSQDINPDSNLTVLRDYLKYTKFGNPPIVDKVEYSLDYDNKVPFLSFNYPGNWFASKEESEQVEWLALFNDQLMFLYSDDSAAPIDGGILGRYVYNLNPQSYEYTSDSYLVEGSTHYTPTNLGSMNMNQPWVEGVEGIGIHQKIYIENKDPSKKVMTSLLISNGYVSYEKPYLYSYNSRLKKIRIYDKQNTFNEVIEINDSPNPIFTPLPNPCSSIVIEILEVYEGEKWQDTCINFIIPFEKLW